MKALVTGGAGFIGHHLVDALLEGGWSVAVLDDLSTGDEHRLDHVRADIELRIGDIRDPSALDEVMDGCDVVFHEAAIASVARSLRNPRLSNDVNTSGTIEVMLAAARAGVARVVFAASSSIYGETPELPRRETQRPDPRSPYAASKLAAENYLHTLGTVKGVETVALRYFNIFGPGQDPHSEYAAVVPRFVTALMAGEAPIVYGDGQQSRDFTYIDNVVQANFLAATVPGVTGLTANVGCGGRYTLLELLDRIGAAVGTSVEPDFQVPRQGDVPHSQADISLASERLGYRVLVDFDDGVRRTVASFLNGSR